VLVDVFKGPLQQSRLIKDNDFVTVFNNIDEIYALQTQLLEELGTGEDILSVISAHLADFRCYVPYCVGLDNAQAAWRVCLRDPPVTQFDHDASDMYCGLGLTEFLQKPMLHFQQYTTSLKNILAALEHGSSEYCDLSQVLTRFNAYTDEIRTSTGDQENMKVLCESFLRKIKDCPAPLLQHRPGRTFVLEFQVTWCSLPNEPSKWKPSAGITASGFLFSDVMVLCKRKREKYTYIKHAELWTLRVVDSLSDHSYHEKCFSVEIPQEKQANVFFFEDPTKKASTLKSLKAQCALEKAARSKITSRPSVVFKNDSPAPGPIAIPARADQDMPSPEMPIYPADLDTMLGIESNYSSAQIQNELVYDHSAFAATALGTQQQQPSRAALPVVAPDTVDYGGGIMTNVHSLQRKQTVVEAPPDPFLIIMSEFGVPKEGCTLWEIIAGLTGELSLMALHVFMCCYKNIPGLTGVELTNQLIDFFTQNGQDIQKNIIFLFTFWRQNYNEDFDLEKNYVISALSQLRPLVVRDPEIAGYLKDLIENTFQKQIKEKIDTTNPQFFKDVDTNFLWSKLTAPDLAKQLSLYTESLWDQVKPKHILTYKPNHASVLNLMTYLTSNFNAVSYWVKTAILGESDLKTRRKIIKKIVQVTLQLLEHKNYFLVFSTMSGLLTSSVRRLKSSWAEEILEAPSWKELNDLVHPAGNFKNYRAALEHCKNTQTSCIPYLGIHLTDIVHLQDGMPNVLEDGRIFFLKHITLGYHIYDLLRLKSESYPFASTMRKECLLWISKLPLEAAGSEEALQDLSTAIEPRAPASGPPKQQTPVGDLWVGSVSETTERFCAAAWDGDIKVIKAFVKDPRVISVLNETNKRGQTALYAAARAGHANVVLELLNADCDPNLQMIGHKSTALHAACHAAHGEVVALLLAKGANAAIANSTSMTTRQEAKGEAIDVFGEWDQGGVKRLAERFPRITQLKPGSGPKRTMGTIKFPTLRKPSEAPRPNILGIREDPLFKPGRNEEENYLLWTADETLRWFARLGVSDATLGVVRQHGICGVELRDLTYHQLQEWGIDPPQQGLVVKGLKLLNPENLRAPSLRLSDSGESSLGISTANFLELIAGTEMNISSQLKTLLDESMMNLPNGFREQVQEIITYEFQKLRDELINDSDSGHHSVSPRVGELNRDGITRQHSDSDSEGFDESKGGRPTTFHKPHNPSPAARPAGRKSQGTKIYRPTIQAAGTGGNVNPNRITPPASSTPTPPSSSPGTTPPAARITPPTTKEKHVTPPSTRITPPPASVTRKTPPPASNDAKQRVTPPAGFPPTGGILGLTTLSQPAQPHPFASPLPREAASLPTGGTPPVNPSPLQRSDPTPTVPREPTGTPPISSNPVAVSPVVAHRGGIDILAKAHSAPSIPHTISKAGTPPVTSLSREGSSTGPNPNPTTRDNPTPGPPGPNPVVLHPPAKPPLGYSPLTSPATSVEKLPPTHTDKPPHNGIPIAGSTGEVKPLSSPLFPGTSPPERGFTEKPKTTIPPLPSPGFTPPGTPGGPIRNPNPAGPINPTAPLPFGMIADPVPPISALPRGGVGGPLTTPLSPHLKGPNPLSNSGNYPTLPKTEIRPLGDFVPSPGGPRGTKPPMIAPPGGILPPGGIMPPPGKLASSGPNPIVGSPHTPPLTFSNPTNPINPYGGPARATPDGSLISSGGGTQPPPNKVPAGGTTGNVITPPPNLTNPALGPINPINPMPNPTNNTTQPDGAQTPGGSRARPALLHRQFVTKPGENPPAPGGM